ncbi:1,4-alpha-glucan branching enzyme [Barrientosiimonas humi]|uniref:1,4-alpha-glucan branching enzyme GlgB n=1 Tax=Barrientosiimonas humi TaxID=999931 RepID=A0A542X9K9_9MICO|nr:1,4-alpha-glucan branching protein GlgB [Barrientosiimonas humi]TQL32523.1 1,4-alpha-glucan branching enzyme [Barrientosiimonas humi]CAG7572515.1 1,4-alpha-glucan branching enzyme GlgB [Barrientosiimonas humi]
MATIHRATLEPDKVTIVSRWIADRRWYAGTGTPALRQLAAYRFDDPDGEVGLETLLLLDESGASPVLYQVPLSYRGAPLESAPERAFLGEMQHSVLGTRYVYDAAYDPVYATELLRAIVQGGSEAGQVVADSGESRPSTATCKGSGLLGTRPRHGDGTQHDLAVTSARVLTGEQSNTSLIANVTLDGQELQVITKVFRVLHDGRNPDVELQGSLTAAGSTRVPRMLGWLQGGWTDQATGTRHTGDLAMAQQFLPGVQDAWREALRAATDNRDFTREARALGEATADVHAQLAAGQPTADADAERVAGTIAGMRARLEEAIAADPSVAEHRDAVERVFQRLESADWPPLQRVHGDYHLGQVLDAPGLGWVLLDFEGEPLRPLAERAEPDAAVRDVAGMLRSFDYAAGSVQQTDGLDRTAWARDARTAFLEGYAADGGLSEQDPLLRAYELDKALYELVYETRHRPDWVGIPRAAVDRLATAQSTGDDMNTERPQGDSPTTAGARTGSTASSVYLARGGGQGRLAAPLPGRAAAPAAAPAPTTGGDRADGSGPAPLDHAEADLLLRGLHRGPHSLLGAHPSKNGATVRVLRPLADRVQLRLADGETVDLQHDYEGIWSGLVPGDGVPDYRVVTTYDDGVEHVADDPYRFLPTLGEIDIHLIGEGRHEQLWQVLGARVRTYPSELGEVRGTSFAVWAPHARAVQVVGDFNRWDGGGHSMRVLGSSGVWELFVPGVEPGSAYKFNILSADGEWRAKADPMARRAQVAPQTASVVTDSTHEWDDEEWMRRRVEHNPHHGPMSTYEVHLGSWRQDHGYLDLAEHLVNYVKDLGFTHVELMPVMDHPYPPSWGYHVTSYYAPNARFGSPDDFKQLVDTLHQNGIGVILDWVPGHFATDEWALARFDGTPLYEHPDPRRGWHPEWGSFIFDFGRPQVRNFLVANAVYWLEEFHVDGLRIDGVASMLYLDYARGHGQWVPNQFGGKENLEAVQLLQETNATVYKRVPGVVTIAEESTSWPGVTAPTSDGGLGFGLKWNMGWMHDSLEYLAKEPVYRKYHHHKMTFGLTYAFSEKFVLPISHDEVVHGKGSLLRKMPGNRWEQLANLRAYLGFMWSHPGKQLLFMGTEFAQEAEWADGRSLDWWLLDQPAHWGVHALTKDLNRIYREHRALWEYDHVPDGFQWLDADDAAGNTYAFVRYGEGEGADRPSVVAICNFSGSQRQDLRIGMPHQGRWLEVLNTDAEAYGGSGAGNLGAVEAVAEPHQGQPASARVTLGPLSTVWFVPEEAEPVETTKPAETTKPVE